MDTERALVSKVIHTGEIETVISRGIQEDHFADEECKEVFEALIRHVRRYKTPPSVKAIKEKFPEFELEISKDSTAFLIDQFVIKVKRRFANESILMLDEAADDPEKAKDIDIHFLDVARQLATIVPSTEV